jgi:hypothetical protein
MFDFMRANAKGLLAAPRILLAAAIALWVAGPAFTQSIRIPDFRQNPDGMAPVPKLGETCENCGIIRSIREVQNQRPAAVPRSMRNDPTDRSGQSNVMIGAVVALPLGDSGSDKPFVGGVGTPEMRERFSETTYEIMVRLDNGGYATQQRRDGASFRVGDRVRVRGIEMELLAP